MRKRMFRTDRELKALKPAIDWYDVRDEITPNLSIRVGPRNSKGRFRRTFILVAALPRSEVSNAPGAGRVWAAHPRGGAGESWRMAQADRQGY